MRSSQKRDSRPLFLEQFLRDLISRDLFYFRILISFYRVVTIKNPPARRYSITEILRHRSNDENLLRHWYSHFFSFFFLFVDKEFSRWIFFLQKVLNWSIDLVEDKYWFRVSIREVQEIIVYSSYIYFPAANTRQRK